MRFDLWLAFVATTLLISGTPGPNMLLMLSHGTRYGWKRAVSTILGALTGLAILFSASAFGLAAILAASATLFIVLKVVGAVYLVYLGVQCWRAGSNMSLPRAESDSSAARYRQGLAVALSNPKAILFMGAFLPQFVDPKLPQQHQWLVLLLTFFVIEGTWQVVYAAGGARLASWLANPRRIKVFNRSCGGAFFTVGGLLALAHTK